MKNPFRFERPHSARQHLGRREELDRLVHAAAEGGRVFIRGKRGVGKTSLLEAAVSLIEKDKKVLPIFMGLRDLVSIERLMEMILVAVAGTVRGEKKIVSLLNTHFGFLRPEPAGYDKDGRVLRIKHLYFTGQGENDFSNLTTLFAALDHFALRLNLNIVLILDDADELRNYFATKEIEALAKAINGLHKRIAGIFAYTPGNHRVDSVFTRLGGLSETMEIQPLFAEDWFGIFSKGFMKIGCGIDQDARYKFEHLAYSGPYFLLTVASRLWDRLRTLEIQKPVSKDGILEMVDEIADSFEPYFAARWRGLTLAQRKAVIAVIHEDVSTLISPDVLSGYRLSGATMERELYHCERLGLLDRDELGESDSWIVPDVFFRRWVEKNQMCAGKQFGD